MRFNVLNFDVLESFQIAVNGAKAPLGLLLIPLVKTNGKTNP